MKTLLLFLLSVAVTLAMPLLAPGVAQDPDLSTEEQPPLVADWEPVQGHLEVPEPLARLGSPKSFTAQENMEQIQKENLEEVVVQVEPHDNEEQESVEAKVRPEVKVDQMFVAEPEVKEEQKVKVKPEVEEQEVKVEPEVKEEQKVKVKLEVEEQEVKAVPEVKEEQNVKVEQEVKEEQDVKVEQEVKAEPEGEPEPQVKIDQEPMRADSDFKEESEVKVEPDVQPEPELIENPMFDEEFHMQMNLEAEAEPGQEVEERHMDMERNYEIIDEPVMESEPRDDVSMFREELSEAELNEMENSMRAAFQSQYSAVEPLSEEELLLKKHVKVEQEVKEQQAMKAEQEVKAEPEDDPEPQVKVDQELMRADSDFKVEPDVQPEPELKENLMFDEEFQVQMNLEAEAEPGQEVEERHMDMERNYEIIDEPVMESEPRDDVSMFREELSEAELNEMEKSMRAAFQSQYSAVEPLSEEELLVKKHAKVEQEVKEQQAMKAEQEVKAEPEDDPEPQVKVDQEPMRADSDFKVEPDVPLEPELRENPMFDEEFHVQMNLEADAEPGQEVEERHMDMERNYEIIDEPVMESEPQDDVSMYREEVSDTELNEMEKSMRAAFQRQYSAVEPLSEEELLVKKHEELNMELEPEMRNEPFDYQEAVVEPLSEEEGLVTMDEEPVMELEPEMRNEPFQSQEAVPDAAIMDEGQA